MVFGCLYTGVSDTPVLGCLLGRFWGFPGLSFGLLAVLGGLLGSLLASLGLFSGAQKQVYLIHLFWGSLSGRFWVVFWPSGGLGCPLGVPFGLFGGVFCCALPFLPCLLLRPSCLVRRVAGCCFSSHLLAIRGDEQSIPNK